MMMMTTSTLVVPETLDKAMVIDLIMQANSRKRNTDKVLLVLQWRVRYIPRVERVVAGWRRIQEKQLLLLLFCVSSSVVALHITVRVHQIKCLNIIISMMMLISLYIIIRGSSIVHSCACNNYFR